MGLKRLVAILLFSLGYLTCKVLLDEAEGPSQLCISCGQGERHRQGPHPAALPAQGATLRSEQGGPAPSARVAIWNF